MPKRYDNRAIFFNQESLYEKLFEDRNLSGIRHYGRADITYPEAKDLTRITKKRHIWKTGDRYYKLSVANYGTPQYWWVIALFNKKPTDASLKTGDLIYIPLPLESILRLFNQ